MGSWFADNLVGGALLWLACLGLLMVTVFVELVSSVGSCDYCFVTWLLVSLF